MPLFKNTLKIIIDHFKDNKCLCSKIKIIDHFKNNKCLYSKIFYFTRQIKFKAKHTEASR